MARVRPPSFEAVEQLLREEHGSPRHHNKRDPLSELVFILLSTQTRESEYRRTFAAIWERYRSWRRVLEASDAELEELIRFGGFARRKVRLLKSLLEQIAAQKGKVSLRYLAREPDESALEQLCALPGVGMKTAKCVLMYALDREVLPVDTHVWRIAQRLGWVEGGKHPDERRAEALEQAVPAELRPSLHVTMVAHGRAVCRARPRCDVCVLARMCPSAKPERAAAGLQPGGRYALRGAPPKVRSTPVARRRKR
jgi:endonuclease III